MFKFDPADVSPNVFNWVIVGLMAVTFIVVVKFVVNTYDNPITRPVREVVNAV